MASSERKKDMKRIAAASFAGAVLEWYDFFLFGTASALVFAPLFFPSVNESLGVISAFATFGVGFVARPVGGIIFGHLGDKYGRKSSLIATLVIIGSCTFLIGVLPTYHQAGVIAPVLLVILRLLQGIGLGGEYGGAALLTIEHAPDSERGFWGSIPQAAASTGILLATGAFSLVSLLPDESFMSWGWRLPFLVSIVMAAIGLFIRLRIEETPDFEHAKMDPDKRIPLVKLIANHPRNLLLALGARVAETGSSNVINAFGLAYVANTLAMNKTIPLTGLMIASILGIFACPVFGYLSDIYGRRIIYMLGALAMAIMAFPFFWLLNSGSAVLIVIAIILAYNLGPTLMFAVQSTFFSEMFGSSVRYTGLSVAYQLSAIVGGFMPLIASGLLVLNGGSPWLVAGLLVVISLLSFFSAAFVRGRAPA